MIKEIERLTKFLDDSQKQKIYACIQDLLSSGIVPGRFKAGESFPSRQDVTHFKERHKEQFDKAMDVVREHLNQVSSIDEMKIDGSLAESAPNRTGGRRYIQKTDGCFSDRPNQ